MEGLNDDRRLSALHCDKLPENPEVDRKNGWDRL